MGALTDELSLAMRIAAEQHDGQVDKAGQPYVFHAMRVALLGETPAEQVAGLLHDVLEDGDMTVSDLHWYGLAPEIIDIVQIVTRYRGYSGSSDPDETYVAFIERICASGNQTAIAVKLNDIADHLREPVPDAALTLVPRYTSARVHLMAARGANR